MASTSYEASNRSMSSTPNDDAGGLSEKVEVEQLSIVSTTMLSVRRVSPQRSKPEACLSY